MAREFYILGNDPNTKKYEDNFDELIKSIKPNTSVKKINKIFEDFFIYVFGDIMEGNSRTKLNDYQKIEEALISHFLTQKYSGEYGRTNVKNAYIDNISLVDPSSLELKFNKKFVDKIAKLESNAYVNMLKDLKNYTDNANDVEELKDSIKKLKVLENSRKSRSIFRKIGDFFSGKKAREDEQIEDIKNNIRAASKKYNLISNNLEYALKSNDLIAVNVLNMSVDVTQKREKKKEDYSKSSIFNEDNKFTYKTKLTDKEKKQNAESLGIAVENYNAFLKSNKLPTALKNKYKKEIADACGYMGLNKTETEYFLKNNDSKEAYNSLALKFNLPIEKDNGELVDNINDEEINEIQNTNININENIKENDLSNDDREITFRS